jgi:1,4-dihydroxy-2-naphthoate octaprenyltransferase
LTAIGLVLAHATNNLLNDFIDYVRGVDKDNYYRAQYGPQPLEHGLMTKRQLLTYAAVTGLLALACGLILVAWRGPLALLLLGLGAFFVLFYTWPLKYIGLGELAVCSCRTIDRRLLCGDRRLELDTCWPGCLRTGRDHRDLRQAYRQACRR